jgi:hypothetical protein
VSTRSIRTTDAHTSCDVCGRTLLRGERAEIYLNGGARRSVCDLCTSRALQEGWIREGTVPAYDTGDDRPERRRSLLSRLRARRDARAADVRTSASPAEEFDEPSWSDAPPAPVPAPVPARRREPRREPRHVHAVPASAEHKVSSAVELFNSSEHRRTVAGVARSLGLPGASVLPSDSHPSMVSIVVAWELCWYRYEVDLSDDQPAVRVAAQGYELDELSVDERTANAAADEYGRLELV